MSEKSWKIIPLSLTLSAQNLSEHKVLSGLYFAVFELNFEI